jgi:2-polyprenyl-3-methyl-5-hydroxy-6-metoxy-1,4-benzoquinol methylase
MNEHAAEVEAGARFEFGKNWKRFLQSVNEERISQAEKSLTQMLEIADLRDKRFLDIGSGSGLFSLAARRLGAHVHSIDYDPEAVECARELKRRYFPSDANWTIEEGSVLDKDFVESLGQFDIVYSWGVLHHTGAMWQALEHAALPVGRNGQLFIAIYNQQRPWTGVWTLVKKTYNAVPRFLRGPVMVCVMIPIEARSLAFALLKLQPQRYIRTWTQYKAIRGMSRWHDWVDWVGGYPFETAKPEEIFEFYRKRGFVLTKLTTCGGGLGCNQFVFEKLDSPA